MHRAVVRSIIGRIGFYLGATAFVAGVWYLEIYMQNKNNLYGSLIVQLSPLQDKQMSAFLEMNRLLITLATSLLGAIGFLLANKREGQSARALWAALASAVCVGLSLYFGYRAYEDIIQMLQPPYPAFDLTGPLVSWDRYAHFFTFLLGVFFFFDFAFHEVSKSKEDSHEYLQNVADS